MNRPQRILAAISILCLAFLFVLTLFASYQFQTSESYSDQAEHSRSILVAVQNLNRGLLRAESAQRGFLLTSNSAYLDSYAKSVETVQAAMNDIAQKLGNDMRARIHVARLRTLVQAKLDELNETIVLEKAHRHPDAIAIVQTDFGKDLMDQIQQVYGTLLQNERGRLHQRSIAIQAGRLMTTRLFRAALIGMALLSITTAFFIRRSLTAQRSAIEALQRSEIKIAEKEHMLRTIADNLPALIAYTDRDEVVRFSNQTYKKWLNQDPAQVLGKRLIDAMGAEMYMARRQQIQTALSGNPTEFHAVLDMPDGPHHHQVSYIPDVKPDGSVAGFFGLTTDITALKALELQLKQLARQDTLTGLPNRRHFEERLSDLLLQHEERPFAMMLLDIDHFKAINDSHGHATGDAALKYLAECLKASVRVSDTLARLAGDEFVVLLPGLCKRSDAEMIARKIVTNARRAFTMDGDTLKITVSIGIAYASEAGVTSEALYACADRALYNAKDANRDTFTMMDCNVIEMSERPARRRRKAFQPALEAACTGPLFSSLTPEDIRSPAILSP
jgi:diguanylate cyclase (GGDEF)-like protein/PAS domain S-box-containing protein